ncbi:DUF805 domain-containing protein [Pediococcus pentosaceus]|uniref:DUF805 domain-containing protein n=1 Tax=Pediococcus pentosaceus TaxID=1255 RepID=UPI003982A0A0
MRIEEIGYTPLKEAVKDFWLGYIDFKGRSTRSGYIGGLLGMLLLNSLPVLCVYVAMLNTSEPNLVLLGLGLLLGLFLSLALLLPSLALTIRRMRDIGLSKIGIIAVLILYVLVNVSISWVLTDQPTTFAVLSASQGSVVTFVGMVLLAGLPSGALSKFSQPTGLGRLFHNVG